MAKEFGLGGIERWSRKEVAERELGLEMKN
jgi:hypothetical protein